MITGEFIFRYEAILCPPRYGAMGRQRCLLPRSMRFGSWPFGCLLHGILSRPTQRSLGPVRFGAEGDGTDLEDC